MAQILKNEEKLLIYKQNEIYKVNINRILMVERVKEGILIYMEKDRQIQLRYSLKTFNEYLPRYFIRTHQSFIVNTERIFKIERISPYLFTSKLDTNVTALISKEHLKSSVLGSTNNTNQNHSMKHIEGD